MPDLDIAVLNQEVLNVVNDALDNEAFMTGVQEMFEDFCYQYVPYITGNLANNTTVSAQGVTYNADYAEEVYESTHPHNLEHHPLASSRWDEVAFANHEEEIGAEVKERLETWIKTKQ